jgi:hypothetical protein
MVCGPGLWNVLKNSRHFAKPPIAAYGVGRKRVDRKSAKSTKDAKNKERESARLLAPLGWKSRNLSSIRGFLR